MTQYHQLQSVVEAIDSVPLESEPCSRLIVCDPEFSCWIVANQAGLVSMARTLLVASMTPVDAPIQDRMAQLASTHHQLIDSDYDRAIDGIEHRALTPVLNEDVVPPPVTWQSRLFDLGCLILGLSVIFFGLSGIVFWVALVAPLFDL